MDSIERSTMAKVSRRLIPFVIICYFVAFLDRVNVSFAALEMNKDAMAATMDKLANLKMIDPATQNVLRTMRYNTEEHGDLARLAGGVDIYKYDPDGLFFSHHAVGSERWSDDGFTRRA